MHSHVHDRFLHTVQDVAKKNRSLNSVAVSPGIGDDFFLPRAKNELLVPVPSYPLFLSLEIGLPKYS